MTEASGPVDPWGSVKLGLLMTAVLFACLASAALVSYQVVFPALGIDPNEGILPLEQPIKAAILITSVLFAALVVCYGGAILGAWIAKRHFPLSKIESQFLLLLWLPGTRTANTRLFRSLFSRQADV